MATYELARLPPTPEVLKIQALLKVAQVQVNDIRNLVSSFSIASTLATRGVAVIIVAGSSKGNLGAMLPSTLDHKDHKISVADQLVTPTRRLINPCAVTPATVSTPIIERRGQDPSLESEPRE